MLDFKDILDFIGFLFSMLFGLFLFVVLITVIVAFADYKLDKTECAVYIENQFVHQGRCHFINISSIGENGNTKHLTIYKDILCLKPLKHYINNDIQIKEVNNANN